MFCVSLSKLESFAKGSKALHQSVKRSGVNARGSFLLESGHAYTNHQAKSFRIC
jgi:hypothetical protein